MKTANHSNRAGIIGMGAAIALLAGFGGNLKGRADAKSAVPNSASSLGLNERDEGTRQLENSAGMSRPAYETTRKRLYAMFRESPEPTSDFEMLAEMERSLGKMTSAEIAEFLRSIPPGLERRNPYFQMGKEIRSWWVLKDGPAALAYMGSLPEGGDGTVRMLTTEMFMVWAGDQPDAAMEWLRSGNLTPKQKERAENLRLNATIAMVENDPESAFGQLAYMGPDEAVKHLGILAGYLGENPEMRQKLLDRAAATGRPEDLVRVRNSMVSKWAKTEPDAALAYIDSLQITDLERQNLDASFARAGASKDPKAALDTWLQRNASATVIPEELNKIVGAWMMPGSAPAVQWLESLPAGGQRDAIYSGSIRAFAGFGDYSKAAELANQIESPDHRARAFRVLDTQWPLSQPEAAAAWKAGLSPEDRALLEEK